MPSPSHWARPTTKPRDWTCFLLQLDRRMAFPRSPETWRGRNRQQSKRGPQLQSLGSAKRKTVDFFCGGDMGEANMGWKDSSESTRRILKRTAVRRAVEGPVMKEFYDQFMVQLMQDNTLLSPCKPLMESINACVRTHAPRLPLRPSASLTQS